MILRRPNVDDIEQIKSIAANYDAPLVNKFETAAVIENKGKIKSFGVIRTILEIVLYCDGSDRDKVVAITKLMIQAVTDCKQLEQDQLYVFAENQDFADILIKHFGFRKAEGVALVLDVE